MKRKITSIPSDVNPNFLNDKKKLKRLFKVNHIEMPVFFEQLSNKLKSKNERKSVFKYVEDYLKGNTISKIRRDISTAKWIKKKPRISTSVRTVIKR